jgi:hypothetical protein
MAGILLLSAGAGSTQAGDKDTAQAETQEVTALFKAVETSFRQKNVHDIVENLHRKFFYIMTFITDGGVTVLENDVEKYRSTVGGFFMSDPEIRDYTIRVEYLERSGEEIRVVARVSSSVVTNGMVSTCDAASNYTLVREKGRLLIRLVRGDATCRNGSAGE